MNRQSVRRPAWLPWLIYLLLMPLMLWLGNWQLDKWHFQNAKLADFDNAPTLPANELPEGPSTQLNRFERYRLSGHYVPGRTMLIDNIVRNGRNGFFVITPFVTNDGSWSLVNRGWILQNARREPQAQLTIDDKPRMLVGRAGALPVGGLKLGEQPERVESWPAILQYPTSDDVSRLLNQTLASPVLLLDPDQPDGFERQWTAGGLPPERHLGYAVQWFAMAGALTIIMLVMVFRQRRTTHGT
ncbi:MAG: SURF1 family protein [Pseudomonadota bacterium]